MNFLEWTGLITSVSPILIVVWVYRVDLILFIIWKITGKGGTISQGVWADYELWKTGKGPYPKRLIYLPISIVLAGIVSGTGLYIHLRF